MYRLYICVSLVCLFTESVFFLHLQAIHISNIKEALVLSLVQIFLALNDGSDSGYVSLIILVHMEIDAFFFFYKDVNALNKQWCLMR